MSDPRDRVVVIGAGIVGVCSAIFLARAGRKVTLVDRLMPGDDGASSFGNAGSLSWSSCIPIAMPGLLPKVPGWLVDRDGPLTVRWRHLATLAPWLWRFVRAGSEDKVIAAAEALSMLHSPSLDLHREMAHEAGVGDLIRDCDYLHVYTQAVRDRLSQLEWRLRAEHGAELELLDGPSLAELEPDLSPRYVQAVRIVGQGFVANPSRLTRALAESLVASGGELLQRDVRGFEVHGNEVHAVRTDADDVPASEVLIAAGAWSTRLTRLLGMHLPLETERGYHVQVENPGVTLSNTVMETDRKFVATPMEMGLRLAGTVELASVDAPPDYTRADSILDHGKRMLPSLTPGKVSRWMGRRPSFPDGLPVIGRAPHHHNVYLAFGHAHTGMVGAPNTGRIVAGMICNQPLNVDVSAFEPERFATT